MSGLLVLMIKAGRQAQHPPLSYRTLYKKRPGIPGSHSDIQYQLAQNSFDHLKACVSSNLIASYHVADGDLQLRPSPFIANFSDQTPPLSINQPLNSHASKLLDVLVQEHSPSDSSGDGSGDGSGDSSRDSAGDSLEQFFDRDRFPLVEAETPRGGQVIISNQSSCPFRAFARHRLHAEPLAEFESGLGSKVRGTAIHLAMEHVYKEIDSLRTLNSFVRGKIDRAYSTRPPTSRLNT